MANININSAVFNNCTSTEDHLKTAFIRAQEKRTPSATDSSSKVTVLRKCFPQNNMMLLELPCKLDLASALECVNEIKDNNPWGESLETEVVIDTTGNDVCALLFGYVLNYSDPR